MASSPAAAGTCTYARFEWSFENFFEKFSELKTEKIYSPAFYAGGCKWRILLIPAGEKVNYLSLYLDVADSETLRSGWSREARFSLSVTNRVDYIWSVHKNTVRCFRTGQSYQGFAEFMLVSELKDPVKGYLLNDTLSVAASVTVRSVVEYSLKEKEPSVERGITPKRGFSGLADASSGKTIQFLAYHVSSEAAQVLEKIHNLHENTFKKFLMKVPALQTAILESFASFIESMSTTKVSEMNEEALCTTTVSVKDFEQVGLDLSWLNQRLDEAKKVNEHVRALNSVDSYVKDLEVARAKVCELEDKIAKAKAAAADALLPKSLGVNDYVLAGVF